MYNKKPKKQELYDQIAALERQNAKLAAQMNEEKVHWWNKRIPAAIEEAHRYLRGLFPNTVKNLTYQHVDEGGYWFTFQLTNDEREQTYCVRHSDLE